MRIGIATEFAYGVGLWKRLADEGNEVRVWRGYLKNDEATLYTSHRRVGEGIVPLEDSWHALLAWVREAQGPALMLFDCSGLGRLADDARKAGVHVVGGGSFCDRLEKDRSWGRALAEKIGLESPGVIEFASIDECILFGKSGKLDRPVYWKTNAYIDGDSTHECEDAEDLITYLTWAKTRTRSNISCILEEKLDGFALSTERWWNGRAWVGPYFADLERKKFMPGNVGPSTGCSINAVTAYEDDEPIVSLALKWDSLTEHFLKYEAPPGIYDMNAIYQDGKALFLEHTPRFGWDSEGISHLFYEDYSRWLWHVATGTGVAEEVERGEIAVSIRLSVSPAPWEYGERDEKGSPVGVPLRGDTGNLWSEPFVGYQLMIDPEQGLSVAAPSGVVGLSVALGDTASELGNEVSEFAKDELRTASPLQFWAVGVGEAIVEDAKACIDEGVTDLPEGLQL